MSSAAFSARSPGFLKKLPALPVSRGSGGLLAHGIQFKYLKRRHRGGISGRIAVAQFGLPLFVETQAQPDNDMPGLETVFENAFPVTETTLGSRNAIGRRSPADRHTRDIFQFDAVGTDVLDRAGRQSEESTPRFQAADPGLQPVLRSCQFSPELTWNTTSLSSRTSIPFN